MIERYLDVRDQGYVDPDHVQQKRIRLLFEVVEKVVPYKLYDERPETVIGSGGERNPDPLQFASRLGGWIAEKHELLEKAESSWREIGTLIYE